MVAVTSLAAGYFVPIAAFLLVFVVVYALLFKTGVLGKSQPVLLFVSFVLASFFVVQASLIEFIKFTSGWFTVLIVLVFFLVALLGFLPGKTPLAFLGAKNWFSWVIFGVVIALFIISASYIFNLVVNWDTVWSWMNTEWFGMILLLLIAAVVSVKITKG
jgi:hypothetical protein